MALTSLAVLFAAVSAAVPAAAFPVAEGWTSVRATGMGNASTAVVEDSDSLFYNPAGLAAVHGFNWTIADPRVGATGAQGYSIYQQYQQNNSVSSLFESLYGQPLWIGGGGKSAVTIPGFGFSAFANSNAHFELSNPAYPTLGLDYFVDYGFVGGAALEVVPEVLRIGAAFKRVNRTGAQMAVGAATLAQLNTTLLQNQAMNRGTGYGMDLGLQLTVPGPVRPSFGVAWKDIGGTAFSHEQGIGAPPPILSNLTVGAAVVFAVPGLKVTPAIDYRYVDHPEIAMLMKLGMGIEIDLLIWQVRAGLNQGYYTLGAGMDFSLLRVDVSTYGVELGEYVGQMQERRYMAQVTMELDFDLGSYLRGKSSSGDSGGRTGLKQRR